MRAVLAIAVCLLAAVCVCGAALPAYQPAADCAGTIRISGSPEDRPLLERWGNAFRRFHPQVQLALSLHGPESTMAGIYTDVADLALVARELRLPVESMAFEWVKLRKPVTIAVANASLREARLASQLAVFVHRDSPVRELSLAQLDAIFGGERKRGLPAVQTWGDLEVRGPLAAQPVRAVGPAVDDIAGLFFRRTVLLNSFKWRADLVTHADPRVVIASVAADPAAVGYAPLALQTAAVRPVAVRADAEGAAQLPRRETIADGSYPLRRVVMLAFDGPRLSAQAREFLLFVLSAEGQAEVVADAVYEPLGADQAAGERERLLP